MEIIDIVILSIAAFFTSALTAVAGAGGGAALMAVMLQFMPPAAAIPVHGAVHLVSNLTRCFLYGIICPGQLLFDLHYRYL